MDIDAIINVSFFNTAIRMMTPIIFAALSVMISSSAGVPNIGVEGSMMIAALFGVVFSAIFQSPWLGLMFVLLLGIVIGIIISFFVFIMKTDITLVGIAINIFGGGGTVFLLYAISGDRGYSTSLASTSLPNVNIPLLQDIPILGEILSGHNILTYLSIILIFCVYIFLYKTVLGLRLRATGKDPVAVNVVGINPKKIQCFSLIASSMFACLGGVYMSMAYMNGFTTNMVAGRGFFGMAAESMAQGNPIAILAASSIFGLSNAMANHLQGTGISIQLIQAIPYVAVILCLIAASLIRKYVMRTAKNKANQSRYNKEKIDGFR